MEWAIPELPLPIIQRYGNSGATTIGAFQIRVETATTFSKLAADLAEL